MKKTRFVFAILFLFSICSMAAFAQDPDQEKAIAAKKAAVEKAIAQGQAAEAEGRIKAELVTVLGAKLGFETKLVKGAPYSAVAVSETVQTLGDGNRIRQTTTTTIYRDSTGRTRREVTLKDGTTQSIAITDPGTGVSYTLNPRNRTATKSEFGGMVKKFDVVRDEEKMRAELERKRAVELQAMSSANLSSKKQALTESLGRQSMEGVEAEGTRTTLTIPAGQIGNDLPINVVSEQWYSPELQLLIMTKHNDPRVGETTYRLTNINRSEPDRSLFEVPGDYTIRTQAEMQKVELDRKVELENKLRIKESKPEEQK